MSALVPGSRGTAVRSLQQHLKSAGVDPGPVDGVFGAGTERAVEAFQRSAHLRVDGIVGPQTAQALRLGSDGFDPAPVRTDPRPSRGEDLTATFDRVSNAGTRSQMVTGTMTVNGHSYTFRSGGFGRGSLPAGSYEVTPHLWSRSDPGMSVGGVGFSFALSDKYDPRVGGTRSLLRIHPDGRGPGTNGCMGIAGDASVQRQFREDMRAELDRNGGRFTLRVG